MLVYWAILAASFIRISQLLDFEIAQELMEQIRVILPNTIAAILIFIVGLVIVTFLATFALTLARNAALPPSRRSTCRASLELRNRVVLPKRRACSAPSPIGAGPDGTRLGWMASAWELSRCSGNGQFPTCRRPRSAGAQVREGHPELGRNPIGVALFYHGLTAEGGLCFASEAKALLPITNHIEALPPGITYDGERSRVIPSLTQQTLSDDPPEVLARQLRFRL